MKKASPEIQKKRLVSFSSLALLLSLGVIGTILWARESRKSATEMPPAREADLLSQRKNEDAKTKDTPTKDKLSIEDGRPLAQAILVLQERFGFVITYEDPRYAHADDISDVTEQVRRDLDKFPRGQAPKVLVPKGGRFAFEYNPPSESGGSQDGSQLVRELLAAYTASGNAGKFVLETSPGFIHVVPTEVKDVSGRTTPQRSVLDEVVTLPSQERTGLQTLNALCAAVSKAARQKVVVGTIPLRLFVQYKDHQERKMKARDALVQLLEKTRSDTPLSWRLLYDPGDKTYVLNIRHIQNKTAPD